MAVPNKKLSYFKVDINIDEAAMDITESKIYEKNGTRYIYQITKQMANISAADDAFMFDAKKHPGVKVVDLK
jgi:outer membrane lipoprotein-sorting protein